jgi:hypothetical protein
MEGLELPDEIRAMFASYRDALPDPDPAVNFMPQLWNRIDARRSVAFNFGRFAKGFVSLAMASCLGMSVLFLAPATHVSPIYGTTYLDALAADLDALAADPSDDIMDPEFNHAGETL